MKDDHNYLSLDLITDPVVILTAERTVRDVNSSCASIIGKSRENIIGKNCTDFDFLGSFLEHYGRSSISEPSLTEFEFNNRHYAVNVHPIHTRDSSLLSEVCFRDVTDFVSLQQELLKRNKELIIINSLSSAFISSENIDQVVESLLSKILMVTDFTLGWLMLKTENSYQLRTFQGLSVHFQDAVRTGSLDLLYQDITQKGEPLYIMEAGDLDNFQALRQEGINFLAAVPLSLEKTLLGILFLAVKKNIHFDFDFASLLSHIGNHVSLILDKINLYQETRRLAVTDGLTGLYNSRFFYNQLDLEIARSDRYGTEFSIILFDIDDFKQLNDTFGHQAGDNALQKLAAIFLSISRETDLVVRYGGEEFVIILPNTSEQATYHLADRIRHTVENTHFGLSESSAVSMTISGGIASYPRNASGAKNLLAAADRALYAAKAEGKNIISSFKGSLDG